ncbi:serine hydrolase [Mangrovivirga sp. M17]|uniref:Serine hydrolase n=1 Tax=Mangrovivirga halotolerans TaxID=2993936 RepID=A0ABT3RMG5_9BACT|nr:serine hydrolase domain-containing protein [Mangrovivirga halotolerans]MCX2743006.1 serine hydrolase [Mangrovivirga halotolerans]
MKVLLSITLIAIFFTNCERENDQIKEVVNLNDHLESLIINENKAGKFDGTIVVGGKNIETFEKAVGIADRNWGIAMERNFVFDIASLNKSFIAALIIIAQEEGKLKTSDKLTDHLSDFDYSGAFSDKITIHQMLTHTSGLPNYDGVDEDLKKENFLKFKRSNFKNSEYVDFISNLDTVASPGVKFHYSNFAYHLLPIILENIYGVTFDELLQRKICEPLKLTNTYSETNNKVVHRNVVRAYEFDPSSGKFVSNDFIDLTLGRRIFSTSEDLYKWAKSFDDLSILSKNSVKLIQTNYLKEIRDDISYGYGWAIFDGEHQYSFGNLSIDDNYVIHGGNTGGYRSLLVNVNNGEIIISILSNIGGKSDLLTMAATIIKTYKSNKS